MDYIYGDCLRQDLGMHLKGETPFCTIRCDAMLTLLRSSMGKFDLNVNFRMLF